MTADGDAVSPTLRDRDDRHRAVGLVAGQGRVRSGHHALDLFDNRREQLLRRRPVRHQRRDPPQRRLLLGEPGELIAARLDHPVRLAQLGVGAPPVGHVPANGEDDSALAHGPCVPLKPAHRAVATDHAVLKADHVIAVAVDELAEQVAHRGKVFRVDGFQERPG